MKLRTSLIGVTAATACGGRVARPRANVPAPFQFIAVEPVGGRSTLTNMMNTALRENILAPYYEETTSTDIHYFERMPLKTLEKLIENNLVETDSWNSCPGVYAMFLPFMRRNPRFTAHGYSISPNRSDSRVTIEGVELDGPFTQEELIDFAQTFRGADEVMIDDDPECSHLRCWYD